MNDCIFCKIAGGEIPSNKVYEDEWVVAFFDLDPQAPRHVLIVPKTHIASVESLTAADNTTLCRMFEAARQLAAQFGVAETGYRLVINTGRDGGQSVAHLHMHFLAGRAFGWPPG